MNFIDLPLDKRKSIMTDLFRELQTVCMKYNVKIGGYECNVFDLNGVEIVGHFGIEPDAFYIRLNSNDEEDSGDEDKYLYDDYIIKESIK